MLWANSGVIKARADRVGGQNLALGVVQQVHHGAVQHPYFAVCDAGGVVARVYPLPRRPSVPISLGMRAAFF